MIIWDNLKVKNSNNTITIDPTNGISGKLNGATGTINAGGTFNGTLSAATGNVGTQSNPLTGYFGGTLSNAGGIIGTSGNPVSGWFNGTLVNANGTINNITCQGLTTLNNVKFNQSVNLPAGSTVGNQPLATSKLYSTKLAVLADAFIGAGRDWIRILNMGNEKLYCHVRQNNSPDWSVVDSEPAEDQFDFYLEPFQFAQISYSNIDTYKNTGHLFCCSANTNMHFDFKLIDLVNDSSFTTISQTVEAWSDDKVLKLSENNTNVAFISPLTLNNDLYIIELPYLVSGINTIYNINLQFVWQPTNNISESESVPLILYGTKNSN